MATASTFSGLWSTLEYDAFPVLYPALLRLWSGLIGIDDLNLRILGFLTGLALLGAMGLHARLTGVQWPMISLILLGLNPVFLRTGDSPRGYGLGIALMLAAQGLLWRTVENPNRKNTLLAALAAVLSVQCLYQNAFFLLAACLAGMAVAMRHSSPRRFAVMAGIGLAAGASLLPYFQLIIRAREIHSVIRPPAAMIDMGRMLQQAAGGELSLMIWSALFLFGTLAAVSVSMRKTGPSSNGRDLALYCTVLMTASTVVLAVFVSLLGYLPQPRYALSWMAVIAASLDAVSGLVISAGGNKRLRVILVALIAGAVFYPVRLRVAVRQTNMDQVTGALENTSAPGDLVVVSPWFYGIGFRRYYKGKAPWTTIPPLSDLTLYRHDLLKKAMMEPDPLEPIVSRMGQTLKSGGRVWLVGDFPILRPGQIPQRLPSAPQSPWGWYSGPYLMNWAGQVSYFLQTHAVHSEPSTPPSAGMSNPDERIRLERVSGWRNPSGVYPDSGGLRHRREKS